MKAGQSRRTRLIAYSGTLAAFYAIGRIVPFSQLIGAAGFVPVSNSFSLLYSLLLGASAGSLSVTIGTVISYFMGKAPIFLGLDFLTPLTAVVVTSLVLKRRLLWLVAGAFAGLLVVFNLSPLTVPFISVPGVGLVPLTWLHLVALASLIAYSLVRAAPPSASDPTPRLVAKVGLASFVGLMMQQLVGSLLFEFVFGVYLGEGMQYWQATWTGSFFVYPIEWLALTAMSVIIAIPVYVLVSSRMALDRA
jgi:hypothetical protein